MNGLPHLGTLVLNTTAVQSTFLTNEKGNWLIQLYSVSGIEINHYVYLNWYYGRVLNVDISINYIEVEGYFPSFSTPPPVSVFSFPTIIQRPPPNVTSVYYTVICNTDWEKKKCSVHLTFQKQHLYKSAIYILWFLLVLQYMTENIDK